MATAVQCKTERDTTARDSLFEKYKERIVQNGQFNRRLVSFQGNRKLPFYGWFKYKEGFSADLVDRGVGEFHKESGVLLDPFCGTGTSLFVARDMGWDGVGVEVLPVGCAVIEARLAAETVSAGSFRRAVDRIAGINWEDWFDEAYGISHASITKGAFPEKTERCIAGFRAYCNKRLRSGEIRKLFELAGLAVLEDVSYTRKDGQYLRWDHRAGRSRGSKRFEKGKIQEFGCAITKKLLEIARDLEERGKGQKSLFKPDMSAKRGAMDLRRGSCLDVLAGVPEKSIDLIVTSPPYCNRYDYTRSYALELVYLGHSGEEIKRLRQGMLSCTVENRTKRAVLERDYSRRGHRGAWERILDAFEKQAALHEVLEILDDLGRRKELNNGNIPNMIRNYFLEMCVTLYEMGRVLRKRGRIVMVNDNVRYAGEEIPVDLVLSDFAEEFDLSVDRIWVLERGKGNSSQQMGVHGRTELRKCVYVWNKR